MSEYDLSLSFCSDKNIVVFHLTAGPVKIHPALITINTIKTQKVFHNQTFILRDAAWLTHKKNYEDRRCFFSPTRNMKTFPIDPIAKQAFKGCQLKGVLNWELGSLHGLLPTAQARFWPPIP